MKQKKLDEAFKVFDKVGCADSHCSENGHVAMSALSGYSGRLSGGVRKPALGGGVPPSSEVLQRNEGPRQL